MKNTTKWATVKSAVLILVLCSVGCQRADQAFKVVDGQLVQTLSDGDSDNRDGEFGEFQEGEFETSGVTELSGCIKATPAQIAFINLGVKKAERFLEQCAKNTNNSRWCSELVRPNPASRGTFQCTYGISQPHVLIHPDESTWRNAFQAVNLIQELEARKLKINQIYNWWRPEPYNKNVGGAAGRHPFGTSVDVRFQTMVDMSKAHGQLCQWRAAGRIRAVGYYGTTALHFGIGDGLANTWGKSCQ